MNTEDLRDARDNDQEVNEFNLLDFALQLLQNWYWIAISVAIIIPAKRNVLDLKNETCKNREKRNVQKISHTRHFKTTKKQSKTGCFYSF